MEWVMRRLGPLIVLVSLCAAGCSQPAPPAKHPKVSLSREAVPLARLPRSIVPVRYRIALTINPTSDRFSGHVEIDARFAEKRRAIFLHGRGLNILAASVRLNARHSIPAHYLQIDKSGVARLIFVDEVPAGKATLVFDYEAPFGKSLSGLYKTVDRGDSYAFTQFESISARQAFPSFDEPDFKTPFQVSVTAPSADKVVSNTPIQATTRVRGGMTSTLFQWTRPLPTYLLLVAVGPFDIVEAHDIPPTPYRSRPVHLRAITARGNGQRALYALSLTPRIVQALEGYFSVPYPFQKLDILAVPDFAAGAMENAGAIAFRERLLLLDPDAPVDQKRSTLIVQAHEITHQWFGDFVTPAWWDDLWLNESFANWMQYKVAQSVFPDEEFDTETLRDGLAAMDLDELPSARQVRQPVNSPDDIANAFDAISYAKGAAVLSMFERFLGEDLFRDAIHAYLTKHAFGIATAQDFIDAVSAATASHSHAKPESINIAIDREGNITWNGHHIASMAALIDQESHMAASVAAPQIAASFANFIEQPGIPYLRLRMQCNGAALVRAVQSSYSPIGVGSRARQWRVPLCLGVEGEVKFCRIADRKSTDILLGATCPAALMPNDEGRGYYRFSLDDWAPLISSSPRLGQSNQIALLHNLSAAMHAGDARPSDLLAAVRTLAPTARWDVLAAMDAVLKDLRLGALSFSDVPAYRAFVANNFYKRFYGLGVTSRPPEKAEKALEREWLAILMVSEARDPRAIDMLATAASAYLSGDRANSPAPELLGEAMRAGLFAKGPPFADLLAKSFADTDLEFYRRQVVYAFAGNDDPGIVAKLLALAPRVRTGELRYFYEYLASEPVASAALWRWYQNNYATLLARVSRDGMARAPSILANACDMGSRNELDAFFSPKTDQLTGTARKLALAEQRISRCVSFRQARSADVTAALRATPH
jgi:alanyl aminopeptidase